MVSVLRAGKNGRELGVPQKVHALHVEKNRLRNAVRKRGCLLSRIVGDSEHQGEARQAIC